MILKLKIFIAKWVCGIIPYKRINGRWYRLPFGVSRAFHPFRSHSYEPHELEAIRRYGPKDGVYLDIGANVGLLSLAMREIAGSAAKIFVVEPNPHAHGLLCAVMKLNHVHPAGIWPVAISNECGSIPFQVSRRDSLGVMSSLQRTDPGAVTEIVPCLTIDALCREWPKLDYIKIDIEGAEILALRGAIETLDRLRPVVQVEVHGPFLAAFGQTLDDLFSLMKRHRYRAVNVVTNEVTDAPDFGRDSHQDARHPLTGENMRYLGYGQIAFLPE